MKLEQIERVFGRGRLRMVTGEHVEVFREAVASGERRRYTKRFLATGDADFRQWTEREWRILARLIGHGIRCVPDVVQFDGGGEGGMRQVQTYDAGVTVDQWATLLPVTRDGVVRAHVFEDCAHWWALAHRCLVALDEIHALQLVHLDIKADNLCIPYDPAGFDPDASEHRLHVAFDRLALIDFAFSLVSREKLATALPIGWQKDYDYQSPRLLRALEAGRAGDLRPTQELDWRCDLYSLAAMLRRYLPEDEWARAQGKTAGWTARRYDDARALVYRLRDCHDREAGPSRPHQELIEWSGAHLAAPDLARSIADGWCLARGAETVASAVLGTPLTRIAPPRVEPTAATFVQRPIVAPAPNPAVVRRRPVRVLVTELRQPPPRTAQARSGVARWAVAASLIAAAAALTAVALVGDPPRAIADALRGALGTLRAAFDAPDASHDLRASAALPADAAAPVSAPEPVPAPAPDPAPAPKSDDPPVRSEPAPARVDPPASSATAAPAPSAVAVDTPPRTSAPAVAPMRRAPHERASPPPPRFHPPQAVARAPRPSTPQYAKAPHAPARVATPTEPATVPHVALADKHDERAVIAAPLAETSVSPPSAANAMPSVTAAPAPVIDAVIATPKQPGAMPSPPKERSDALASTERSTQKSPHRDPLRAAVHDLLRLIGVVEQRPAPVDDRIAQAPGATSPQPRAPSARPRAVERAAPAAPAPIDAPPLVARAIPPAAQPEPAIAPVVPRPPMLVAAREPNVDADDGDLAVQGRRMLADAVPRIAAQARADATRVLWTAAVADSPAQERAVAESTYVPWRSERAYLAPSRGTSHSRQLHQEARRAFTTGRDQDAIDLGLRALAANPRDPDVAGFLALLHLKKTPAEPETARELALYALAFSGQTRSERLDDWNTLAIASALTGRDVDASQAFLVELALSRDVERSCKEALRAYDTYGERLRRPVETLLLRVHAQRRAYDSTACAWPPYRTAAR